MTFPCYPKYKASGFIWLGDVPESWALKRLGHYFDERRERASDTEFEPLSVTKHGIVPRLESAAKTQDGDNRKKVLAGDFVINSRSDRKGSSGLSPLNGSVSLICTVLTPSGLHGPFIHHLFRSELFQEEYYRWGKGIVADLWSTNFSDMKNIVLGVPSEAEQTQIARFLDHETARIDALIEEQQRLIELLKEKRQAVISKAVTKGLDPTVPMKDSGVEWLGEVPAHWEVKPLRYVSTMIDGDRSSAYPSEGDLVGEGIPFVSSKNIVGYKFTDKNLNYITQEKFNSLGRGKLCDGDLVITVRGTIGHVAVFDSAAIGSKTGFINAQMMIIRPHAGLTEYIRLCSESFFWQKQLDVAAYGSTVKQLSNPIVGGLVIALPPRAEIPALTSKVRALESEFETLISEALVGTNLLQERRSALISAAVTGKIDVRGWQLPTSAPTPELAQEAV